MKIRVDSGAAKTSVLSVEYYSSLSNKKKRKLQTEGDENFSYKFVEGVNNAVKYDVKMSFFLSK